MTLHAEPLVDIRELGPFMLRNSDARECEASGLSVTQAVQHSIKHSTKAYAIYYRRRLMAIWGYRQPFIGCVTIWLLTTPMVDKYPVTFYREGKRLLDLIMAEFGLVECYVWRPYKKARTWLERLGFKAYPVHELNSISPFTRMIKESL